MTLATQWASTPTTPADGVATLVVEGDNMRPTIAPGDVVQVDRAATDPHVEGAGVYVIDLGTGGALLRRVEPLPDGRFALRNDNPQYPDHVERASAVWVLGRAVRVMRAVRL